jgi:hypothetical protein
MSNMTDDSVFVLCCIIDENEVIWSKRVSEAASYQSEN